MKINKACYILPFKVFTINQKHIKLLKEYNITVFLYFWSDKLDAFILTERNNFLCDFTRLRQSDLEKLLAVSHNTCML